MEIEKSLLRFLGGIILIKFYIDYNFPNWNEYIDIERSNKFKANKLKQEEKALVRYLTRGMKYTGNYPVEITFKKHFKDRRSDLDNVRVKGLLDGLVSCGVLKNDNLKHITKITIEPVFDDKTGIEVEIKEVDNGL